jgi:hypothetical protein
MQWGNWTLKPDTYELDYKADDGPGYDVPLDEITSSAAALDWVYQMHTKTWMTPRGIHDMLTAIDDVIGGQGNLCSGGSDHRVNAKALVDGYVARMGT